jgi:8-oxo-dGTP pyrophosphatase MutT (NUDIX family)
MNKFPYSLYELESWKINTLIVKGVWLTVKDISGNLFLVLEKELKAWKKPGQWSIVMETIEKGEENCLLSTVRRWLKEELGVDLNNGEKIWSEDFLINFYVYDSKKDKVYKVYLYLYDIVLTKNQVNQALKFTNWEVGKVKIVTLDDIKNNKISPLRPWTKEVVFWNEEPFFVIDWEIGSEKK